MCRDPRLVGIVDDEFADASFKQGDRDGAACAASADEEYPRSLRLSSVISLTYTKSKWAARLLGEQPGERNYVRGPPRAVGVALDSLEEPGRWVGELTGLGWTSNFVRQGYAQLCNQA